MNQNEFLETVAAEVKSGTAILIDVREDAEWKKDHIELAKSFPLSEIAKGHFPDDFPIKRRVYIHCQHGARAKIAEALIRKINPDAFVLEISYDELKRFFA